LSWLPRGAEIATAVIRIYQQEVACRLASRVCRFKPSCSHYALGAIERHGLIRGCLIAWRRVRRCRPENPGGVDPVP